MASTSPSASKKAISGAKTNKSTRSSPSPTTPQLTNPQSSSHPSAAKSPSPPRSQPTALAKELRPPTHFPKTTTSGKSSVKNSVAGSREYPSTSPMSPANNSPSSTISFLTAI